MDSKIRISAKLVADGVPVKDKIVFSEQVKMGHTGILTKKVVRELEKTYFCLKKNNFGLIHNTKKMTRIVLEVPQEKDLNLLLALLERLNIRVIDKTHDKDRSIALTDDQAFILRGLPANKEIENLIQDFESSRKDRPLPGREN